MGCPKGVIHIKLGHCSKFFCKSGVIGLLLSIIANVFQKKQVCRLHGSHSFFDLFANAVIHKSNFFADKLTKTNSYRGQRHGWLTLTFWTSQMRCKDNLGTGLNQILQSGQSCTHSRIISDHHHSVLFFQRYVIVYTHKYRFAVCLQIFQRKFCHMYCHLCGLPTSRLILLKTPDKSQRLLAGFILQRKHRLTKQLIYC